MSIELGQGTGPLRGVRVVEIAGIGPGPHACMILADLGADVIRVDRPGGQPLSVGKKDVLTRGRPSVVLDLKRPEGRDTVLRLAETADVLIESMRAGVAERLGIGPEDCHERNERLIYGRMTGWGQHGPLAHAAGHDIDYIAVAGALHGLGQDRNRPHFPSNLLGDFGGGSTYLVIGVLAALLEVRTTGRGQVIDAAIVDGTAHLNAAGAASLAAGLASERRASGFLDGGAPYYDVYETADHKHMAVGALEPKFYALLLELLGITDDAPRQTELERMPELRQRIEQRFRERTQAEWVEVFEGTDACVAGVIPLREAAEHPHLKARGTFTDKDGILQPAPAPRFSRTSPTLTSGPSKPGQHTREALQAWGIDGVESLIRNGVAVQHGEKEQS